jgi:predicted ATP-dependent endonuclease of OLD family
MLKSLRLENFKSFKNAELSLGDLTVLVGTNASGKSNIRDAFRREVIALPKLLVRNMVKVVCCNGAVYVVGQKK